MSRFTKKRITGLLITFLLSGIFFSFAAAQEQSRVTNSFFETDLREALRDIASQTGVKIVADDTVQGSVSIELKDVPLEESLRMVLSVGNYAFRKMPDGYYLVGLCTPESPSFGKLSVTEYFRPNYFKAAELQSLVSEFYRPYIKMNEESNSLTITASPDMVERLRQDLTNFDRPQQQVMIEALVLEVTEEGKKSLGITWGSMLEGGFSVTPPKTLDIQKFAVDRGWSLAGDLTQDILLRLNTLVSNGQAKVRANPRVATMEGKQAEIFVGREEYFLINVGSAATAYYTLQSIATGVVLKITPYVDQDHKITVSLNPQVSEVVARTQTGTTNLPVVTRRTATTSLRVNDGETFAMGGLVQELSDDTLAKVPFLGSVPGLGWLFKNRSVNKTSKEVIIFITPHLIAERPVLPAGTAAVNEAAAQGAGDRLVLLTDAACENLGAETDPVNRYYRWIGSIIHNRKEYSKALRKLLGNQPQEVTVKFIVSSDGSISGVQLLNASGIAELDEAATQTVENATPLPPFPREIDAQRVAFVIPLEY